MTEIVIDPQVPVGARRELEQAPLSALLGFGDPLPRVERDDEDEDTENAAGPVLVVYGSLIVGITLNIVALCSRNQNLGFLGDFIIVTGVVFGCLYASLRDDSETAKSRAAAHLGPAAAYHRRYVVPELDLHGDELARWRRASEAAQAIRDSEAVRLGLIDTIPVDAVLPYDLWEIAERLALLSAPERRQASILEDLDADDPDLQAVLGPQRRVRELTEADIDRRVGRLAEFADLASRADAARERQRTVDALAKLNPDYEELLARLGEPDGTLSGPGGPADDLRALAAEADDAVRRVNEAGPGLLTPSVAREKPES